MEDPMSYIIVGLIVIFIIYMIMRNQSTATQSTGENRDYRQRGTERPRYDDPDIRGRGGFGNERQTEPDPELDWLKRGREGSVGKHESQGSTNDSPKIEGRGGFGRDKKRP